MSMSKGSKMAQFINYRMRFIIQDERQLVGIFMGFDRHMNIVIGDCEEFRKLPSTKGSKSNKTDLNEERERRTLGLVILRGEEWISTAVEGPPPPDKSRTKSMSASASAVPGSGLGRAAGRGVPNASLVHAQPGLAGPVCGVGGPAPGMMQPQISRPPVPALQFSALGMTYPNAPVMRPPGQKIQGFPPQSGPPQMPLRGPPPPGQYPPGSRPGSAPPGHFQMPPHYAQRPGMPVLPPPMMCGPPPPSRPGMPPPPGGQVPVYGPPRPGMPPPPNSQQPPQNQRQ
ncbi:small nuclear ribonucleoprotein-associated protein B-like [Chenopodium quinoa]|uniref:small nuclear ribonucleoprotein-associated protein B-like n=1 Tax=Chenopodium quinoa TaxID=63459 RepID=UPI000B78CAD2|nr:small nuclear ribonucleoprotein-associated protein B-like [Chenopodium quinoa]